MWTTLSRPAPDGRVEVWAILHTGTQLKLKMGWADQADEQLYKRTEKYPDKTSALAERGRAIDERVASGFVEVPPVS